MEASITREQDTLIVQPKGRIESLDALEFQKIVEDAMQPSDRALVLDMKELSYISSAGLRIVAIMINRTNAAGIDLALCALSNSVSKVVVTSGFNQLVPVLESREEACQAVVS